MHCKKSTVLIQIKPLAPKLCPFLLLVSSQDSQQKLRCQFLHFCRLLVSLKDSLEKCRWQRSLATIARIHFVVVVVASVSSFSSEDSHGYPLNCNEFPLFLLKLFLLPNDYSSAHFET